MTPNLLLAQLYVIRGQLDVLIGMAEGIPVQESGPPACEHPEDRRVPASNMGEEPTFYCQACKQMVKAAQIPGAV